MVYLKSKLRLYLVTTYPTMGSVRTAPKPIEPMKPQTRLPDREIRLLAVWSFFLLLLSAPTGRSAEAYAHPNIIFILVDDLRWDALGCMGHPFVKTPNIDRIAKEGALFKNFFVSIPLCSPSRGSFL